MPSTTCARTAGRWNLRIECRRARATLERLAKRLAAGAQQAMPSLRKRQSAVNRACGARLPRMCTPRFGERRTFRSVWCKTAKTVVNRRAKNSGQRWSAAGLRGVLTLRAALQSDRLPRFWRYFSRRYTAAVEA